jgi:hypothetical protein
VNKTKKRAIQKHRARALKFEARRKEAGATAASVPPRMSGANATTKLGPDQRGEPTLAVTPAGGEET